MTDQKAIDAYYYSNASGGKQKSDDDYCRRETTSKMINGEIRDDQTTSYFQDCQAVNRQIFYSDRFTPGNSCVLKCAKSGSPAELASCLRSCGVTGNLSSSYMSNNSEVSWGVYLMMIIILLALLMSGYFGYKYIKMKQM